MRSKLGIESRMIHSELVSCLRNSAPTVVRTVYRWVERSQTSGESTEDRHKIGRPITGCCQNNINLVQALVEEDSRISLNSIEDMISICRGTIVNIIRYHLNMRKLSSRWIPHSLSKN